MNKEKAQILTALRQARSIWGNEAMAGRAALKAALELWPKDVPLPQEEEIAIGASPGRVSTLDEFRVACEMHGRKNNWVFLRAWVPNDGGLEALWMLPDGTIREGQGWVCLE